MPLVLDRNQVRDVYAEARERRWVLPTFNSENLTTTEAILSAVKEYGSYIGINHLPVNIGITNKYKDRPQAVLYSHTKQWEIGLRIFLNNLEILTSPESPYSDLNVMIHLDHIIWDEDRDLFEWDMKQFSSIMYDASNLPFEMNMKKTADFVTRYSDEILIEGACDAISDADSSKNNEDLTTPDMAEEYFEVTGVDIIVPNLGTEHRATASTLKYHSELARKISSRVGPNLCLHGTSSVSISEVSHLFEDGICKVNLWTALERDSSYDLFINMLRNAAKIIGSEKAKKLVDKKLLGEKADQQSRPSLDFYTNTYRQQIIFQSMKEIITGYLKMWYK